MRPKSMLRAVRARRGITLLEILIAVGVLAIGLLGLASLLPVGRYELQQALKFDRGSALGRAAFRDLLVRGALRPDNWLYPLGGGTGTPVLTPAGAGTAPQLTVRSFSPPPGGTAANAPPLCPMVLDPLMLAANPVAGTEVIPFGIGTIPRITLRQMMSNSVAPVPNVSAGLAVMPFAAADRLFRSGDDLEFTIYSDKIKKPLQSFSTVQTKVGAFNANQRLARQSHGDFSWMVVISPEPYEALGVPDPVSGAALVAGNAATTRMFSVAVVVFFKRDLTVNTVVPPNDPKRSERAITIDFLGIGSGEARIRPATGGSNLNPDQADQALRVLKDQWLMAYGPFADPRFPTLGQQTITAWYRIASSADVVQKDSNGYYRSVKLMGRDWPAPSSNTAVALSGISGMMINGIVNVYEKTFVLDGTSAWSEL